MRQEAPIPKRKPKTPEKEVTPPPPPTPSPSPEPVIEPEPELELEPEPEPEPSPEPEEEPERLPMLICGQGVKMVIPKEKTRDVLAGKVDYLLVDEKGLTFLKKKHFFNALKLDRSAARRLDYPCVGAHQRLIQRKPLGLERSGNQEVYFWSLCRLSLFL